MADYADNKKKYEILARALHRLKEDNPVTVTPCGLRLVSCSNDGVKEIEGFEDLPFRDKVFVLKTIADMHQDIFTKAQQVMAKQVAEENSKAQGMQRIIQATEQDSKALVGV